VGRDVSQGTTEWAAVYSAACHESKPHVSEGAFVTRMGLMSTLRRTLECQKQ